MILRDKRRSYSSCFPSILKRMERLRGEGQRQRGHCHLLAEKAPTCDGLAMLHRRFTGALGRQ
jgi:hypothetical protein